MKHTDVTATADIYSIPAGQMFRFLLLRHCFWATTCTVLVGLALITIGPAVDLRLTVIGLMIWCILLPMLLAWCWFRYALTPVNAFNLQPHSVNFKGDTLELTVYPKRDEPAENSDDVSAKESGGKEGAEEESPEPHIFRYSLDAIDRAEPFGSGYFFHIVLPQRHNSGWLYIPISDKALTLIKSLSKNAE